MNPLTPPTPPAPPAPPAAPARVQGSTPEKILDTAEALFARRGFGSVGLREVARDVGLSKSAVFHHFPTKADLYHAVLVRILGGIAEGVLVESDARLGPLARLIRIFERLVDALAESPNRAPLLLRTLFEDDVVDDGMIPEAEAMLESILDRLRALIDQGIGAGELRDVPSAHVLQSLLGGLLFHFASGEFGEELIGEPTYSAAAIRRHKAFIVSFIEHGLAARPPER